MKFDPFDKPTRKGVAMRTKLLFLAVLTAATLFGASNTAWAQPTSAPPTACNKTAVQNSPAYHAYETYFNVPPARKCTDANVSSLQGTSQLLQRVLTTNRCSWGDIAPFVLVAGPANLGCGPGANPSPNVPAPASQPSVDSALIPVYLPWGGAAYRTLSAKAYFDRLSAFLVRAKRAADARKALAPTDERKDDMDTLADGFNAGSDYALARAKDLGDVMAQKQILANRALRDRGCSWSGAASQPASAPASQPSARLVCRDNADRKDLAALTSYLSGVSLDAATTALIQPLLVEAASTNESDLRLYIVWYVISMLPPGSVAYLTMNPKKYADTEGLAHQVPAGSLPDGEPRINVKRNGAPRVDITSAPDDHVYIIDAILFGRSRSGLALEVSPFLAVGVSNPSRQADNGLGGFSVGVNRRFDFGRRISLEPNASLGWVRVAGESSQRQVGGDTPEVDRNAFWITAGTRVYVHLGQTKKWSLYGTGSAILRPGWGGMGGAGVERRFRKFRAALEAQYVSIPNTGISAGKSWGKSVGNVGLKGPFVALRIVF